MEELQPIYSKVNSFYGKAKVIKENRTIKPKSYNTIIATIENGKLHINGFYSQTSSRHYGFETGTKAELEKLYC